MALMTSCEEALLRLPFLFLLDFVFGGEKAVPTFEMISEYTLGSFFVNIAVLSVRLLACGLLVIALDIATKEQLQRVYYKLLLVAILGLSFYLNSGSITAFSMPPSSISNQANCRNATTDPNVCVSPVCRHWANIQVLSVFRNFISILSSTQISRLVVQCILATAVNVLLPTSNERRSSFIGWVSTASNLSVSTYITFLLPVIFDTTVTPTYTSECIIVNVYIFYAVIEFGPHIASAVFEAGRFCKDKLEKVRECMEFGEVGVHEIILEVLEHKLLTTKSSFVILFFTRLCVEYSQWNCRSNSLHACVIEFMARLFKSEIIQMAFSTTVMILKIPACRVYITLGGMHFSGCGLFDTCISVRNILSFLRFYEYIIGDMEEVIYSLLKLYMIEVDGDISAARRIPKQILLKLLEHALLDETGCFQSLSLSRYIFVYWRVVNLTIFTPLIYLFLSYLTWHYIITEEDSLIPLLYILSSSEMVIETISFHIQHALAYSAITRSDVEAYDKVFEVTKTINRIVDLLVRLLNILSICLFVVTRRNYLENLHTAFLIIYDFATIFNNFDYLKGDISSLKEIYKSYVASKKLRELPQASDSQLRVYEDVCAVCHQELGGGKRLPCGHILHESCLSQCFRYACSRQICPLCRAEIFYREEKVA